MHTTFSCSLKVHWLKQNQLAKQMGRRFVKLISNWRLVHCIALPSRSAIRGSRTGLADSLTISPMFAVWCSRCSLRGPKFQIFSAICLNNWLLCMQPMHRHITPPLYFTWSKLKCFCRPWIGMKCKWKHTHYFPLQHKKSKSKMEPAGKVDEQKVHSTYAYIVLPRNNANLK